MEPARVRWLVAIPVLAFFAWAACTAPDAGCAGFAPLRFTAAELAALSSASLRQVTAHNAFGEKHCGWRP
jgi:hypothetical protein